MTIGSVLELIREIICYNQAKCLSYFNEMGRRHWELSRCLSNLRVSDGYSNLKKFYDEFIEYADTNLRDATEKNFIFIKKFFNSRSKTIPRACIKANYEDKIIELFRDDGTFVSEGSSYKENSGFLYCVEKGSYYLCNNIPKAAKEGKYFNPRLKCEMIQKIDPVKSKDWVNFWIGYGNVNEPIDPKSAYKSTLIIPIALRDKFLTASFKARLGFDGNADHTIWGYLCFDHTEINFFDDNIDIHFGYIMADILSLFLITRANFTVHSKTFKRADDIISLAEEA